MNSHLNMEEVGEVITHEVTGEDIIDKLYERGYTNLSVNQIREVMDIVSGVLVQDRLYEQSIEKGIEMYEMAKTIGR